MENSKNEQIYDWIKSPTQHFAGKGPFEATPIISGIYRDLLTEWPLASVTNIATVPHLYNIGLAFYIPENSTIPEIRFCTSKKEPYTLFVTITYVPSTSSKYTMYDFHHIYNTSNVQMRGLQVDFIILKYENDPIILQAEETEDTKTPRGTYAAIQYTN